MSEPHRMTLRPPWEREELPDGHIRHRRRFGRPRTLGPGETVWLVGGVTGRAEVRLNGERLGEVFDEFAFEVTARLELRNEVTIDATGPLGPVAIEIR